MDLDGLDYEELTFLVKILKQDKDYYSMLYALIHMKNCLPLDAFMKKTV